MKGYRGSGMRPADLGRRCFNPTAAYIPRTRRSSPQPDTWEPARPTPFPLPFPWPGVFPPSSSVIVAQVDDPPPLSAARAGATDTGIDEICGAWDRAGGAPPCFFRRSYPAAQTQRSNTRTHEPRAPAYAGNSRNPGSAVPAPLARPCVSKQTPRLLVCFRWAFLTTSRIMIGVLVPCEAPLCAQSTSDVMPSRFNFFLVFVLIHLLLFRCASPIRPLLSWMGPNKRASKSS